METSATRAVADAEKSADAASVSCGGDDVFDLFGGQGQTIEFGGRRASLAAGYECFEEEVSRQTE